MADTWLLPASFVLSFLGTLLNVFLARNGQWLDHPNSRSSHSVPTPTSGGLACILVFTVAIILAFRNANPGFNHYFILFLGICIAGLGLADDVLKLGITSRLTIQAIVVICVIFLFGVPELPLPGYTLEPGWFGYFLAAAAFLWLINLFNFMDGIDGIAASEFLFVLIAVQVITYGADQAGIRVMILLLIASVCGFLLLNLPPAKIFMGDTGSNFLGYMLGVVALASTTAGVTTIWVWCVLGGAFIVDASYTLIVRIVNRETWYHAHRTHAYQRLADYYGSHGKVVSGLWLINCLWLLPMGWLAHRNPDLGLLVTCIAWLPLIVLVRLISNAQISRNTAL